MLLCPRTALTLPRGEEATGTLQPQALSGPISRFSFNTFKAFVIKEGCLSQENQ